MTVPTKHENWVAELAFEVALGYYSPQDLQLKFDLPFETYSLVTAQPEFSRAVQLYRREIDENGEEFRLKARKHATLLVDELSNIALDPRATHSDRLTAIRDMCKLAGHYATDERPQTNNAFQININLA